MKVRACDFHKVTCWLMIDTVAMIGSPASRGAVASMVGAGRDCLAAASAVGAASAAIAASVTNKPRRRRHGGLRCHVEPNSTISRFLRVSQHYDRREQ